MKTKTILIRIFNWPMIIIFLAFFFAKIYNLIDWAWIWVFCPLWIIPALFVGIYSLIGIMYLSTYLIIKIWK